MDPNSYQAYMVGQAGPDNPYRPGPTPFKYVKHLAKIAPFGRFGGVVETATSPSNPAISPCENPYTAITRPVAGPSNVANRAATSPLIASNTRAITPTPTTIGPTVTLLIALDTRAVTPTVSNGGDSIPSSPSQSPARSPSPDAEALISSLANYESLSDDALYDATLKAQQAMVKWQNEYMALENEISRTKGSPYNSKNRKANPRKLEDPDKYDQKHHASLHHPTSSILQTPGKHPKITTTPRPTNSIKTPPPKRRGPRNELHIDMTTPMQPVSGKRTRKPRLIDPDTAAAPAPKIPTKRPRDPNNEANTPTPHHPPAKKKYTHTHPITPPPWVRTARAIKAEPEEPSADPSGASEMVPQKREGAAKSTARTGVEKETEKEKDPVRAAAARLMWAKRKARGTNGRYGGRPTEKTVAKARGREGGM